MLALVSPRSNAAAKKRVPARTRELTEGLTKLQPELMGRALRMARRADVAEDLVQDTVERAIRFQDHYEPGTNLRAWAYQILFSVFVTRYRRVRRERNALKSLAGDPCAWTVPNAFKAPDATAPLLPSTQAKLDSLPEGFRAVLVLVDLDELSYREAASELGVPVGTVMSRLHRGRRLLAVEMSGVGAAIAESEAREAA
jgi:RNA polymerase sigma-70 factor (ECF subfamily)